MVRPARAGCKQHGCPKTPFLGDLPVLGRMFRRDISRDDKQELLIFITPKIVEDTFAQ